MGTRLQAYGDSSQTYPYQIYILLHVENMAKWGPAYAKLNRSTNPPGRLNMMGQFSAGRGPDGANVWVINGFKDFKSAMGGINSMMTPQQKQARDRAWEAFQATEGVVTVVRNGMRILMKTW